MKNNDQTGYSVKKLSDLAGVSVRTLHLYDEIGLLKPRVRSEARYRFYGEAELLRLQQILFYRELDFSLQEIAAILDDPDFNLVVALKAHRVALESKRDRLERLLHTVDSTINKIQNQMALTDDELYDGFPRENIEVFREEAKAKYGSESVDKSERYLKALGKDGFAQLKNESKEITARLLALVGADPQSPEVQTCIARHYEVIRKFWGTHGQSDPQAEAYAGLGDLYVSDERFTTFNGKAQPAFALFMQKAMHYFARSLSKG